MELHSKLTYDDIKEAKKITIGQDMLVRMNKYYNPIQSKISYDFKTLNIEMDLEQKINIYIENTDDDCAIITYFNNEEKQFSFQMEYIFNIGYSVLDIVEYEAFSKCNEKVEAVILAVLGWYPMILFYIQQHSSIDLKQYTFFVNTPNNKLDLNFKTKSKSNKKTKKTNSKKKTKQSNNVDNDKK